MSIIIAWFMVARGVFVLVCQTLVGPRSTHRNTILRRVLPPAQLRREWLRLPMALAIDYGYLQGAISLKLINPEGTLSFGLCVSAIVFVFIGIEIPYYIFHRAQHEFPALYKMHAKHHRSVIPTPATSLTFSFLDRFLLTPLFVIPLVVWSYFFHCFPLALMLAAVALHDVLNTMGHLNREIFPEWYLRSVLSKIIYTPTTHAMHHAKQRGNYSLFVPLFDVIFKSVIPEEAELKLRARRADERRISSKPSALPNDEDRKIGAAGNI